MILLKAYQKRTGSIGMDRIKLSCLGLIAVIAIGSLSWLISGLSNTSPYCENPTKSEMTVRDWVVENTLTSGFLSNFGIGSKYGSGGYEADSRDAFGMTSYTYCLNVHHGQTSYRIGKSLSFFVIFSFLMFVFGLLVPKLRVWTQQK